MRWRESTLVLPSTSPYSFILVLMSVFSCFGTGNQRFQKTVCTACRCASGWVSRVPIQWHSFSGFCHSVKDSVLGLGYPLIFYSVSELPVPVLPCFAAIFRPVFGIAVHRTCPDGAVADTGRSRRPYELRFPGGRMHAEVAGSRCWPPPPQVRA